MRTCLDICFSVSCISLDIHKYVYVHIYELIHKHSRDLNILFIYESIKHYGNEYLVWLNGKCQMWCDVWRLEIMWLCVCWMGESAYIHRINPVGSEANEHT